MAIANQRPFTVSKSGLLLLAGGIPLAMLAVNSWNQVGPQSLICRHRDDPKGIINFRVDVGQGDDRVRFADGQTIPVQASRDQITFLEKESNNFHLSDNDSDEAALGMANDQERQLGIAAPTAPLAIHIDRRHDVEHRTTIDRRQLTFQEQSLTEDGKTSEVIMTGQCQPAAEGLVAVAVGLAIFKAPPAEQRISTVGQQPST